jgi:CNT family concentrative nucleoside transporter
MERITGLLGIVVLVGIAYAVSTRRRSIPWRVVGAGMALQLALGWLLLVFAPAVAAVDWFAARVNRLISCAADGGSFVLGRFMDTGGPWGFVFIVQVVPVIIFFAALMAVLYHLGLMQRLIAALAWCLRKTMGVTATEALTVAANIFVGQTEAPLCVRPYIKQMTRSQLTVLMAGGFATIAGSVLGAYVLMLGGDDEAARILFTKHLLIASILSAPAAIAMAKIMVPETEQAADETGVTMMSDRETRNVLDAAAVGATDGLRLGVNVAAMLIAFVALLALVNWPLEAFGDWRPIAAWRDEAGVGPLSLQVLLGWLLTPLAWVMGVPWGDCPAFASLLGQKLVVTEFVAFGSLAEMTHDAAAPLHARTTIIAAYALCGFANFPSIAIQIGGISALSPDRRSDLASLALRAMFAGAFASWCTACVAGLFITGASA